MLNIKNYLERYKDAEYAKACQMIDKIEWDGLLNENYVDRSAINWYNKFMEVMSTCIPQQSLKCKRNEPWLTKIISRQIRIIMLLFKLPGSLLNLHNSSSTENCVTKL